MDIIDHGGGTCATESPETEPRPAAGSVCAELLGWPWAGMLAARLAHDDAKRREHAATIAGDVAAREAAILDQLEAQGDEQKLRDALTSLVVNGLRIALHDNPTALVAVLSDAIERTAYADGVRADLDALTDELLAMRDRRRKAVAA